LIDESGNDIKCENALALWPRSFVSRTATAYRTQRKTILPLLLQATGNDTLSIFISTYNRRSRFESIWALPKFIQGNGLLLMGIKIVEQQGQVLW